MSPAIVVHDASGTRRFGEADLPLRIGTGPAAAIRLPGPVADQSHALMGLLDGRPFLQPTGAQVTVNEVPLTGTRWLADGDEIGIGSARIRCVFSAGALEFRLRFSGVDYDTLPPEADPPQAAAAATDPAPSVPPRVALKRSATPRWRTPAIWAALAMLALCAFWLLTSRAVLIAVDPAVAVVDVQGIPDLRFAGRYLLRPGAYTVRATAEGYAPGETGIEVTDAPSQDFSLRLERLPGQLVIGTQPAVEAEVSIDGVSVGRTPTAGIDVVAGSHQLRIVAPRYQPWETALTVEGGGVVQAIEAQLVPDWADVAVSTVPEGAAVLVDGEPAGTTPAKLELLAGERTLSFQKDGFKTLTRRVTAVANQPQQLSGLKLEQADGLVRIISEPPGATVTVAGRYRGVTPLETGLPPGRSYTVALSKPGYESVSHSVDLVSSRGATLRVELVARIGVVRVSSEPPDAELLVDGKSVGIGPRELSLPAFAHRFEFRKPGFVPHVSKVTPQPGQPQVLAVKLLTPQQAVIAATPRTVTTSQGQELRLIQPGEFRMGAPRREQGRRANETERDVRLTRPFYIGTREVTNSQYRAFQPRHTSGAEKYQQLAAGTHPVVMLSWQDAAAYCNWLSDQEQRPRAYTELAGQLVLATPPTTGYRLPTEAEWEWAARYTGGAGSRRYPWGDAMPPPAGAGNYADRTAQGIVSNVLADYSDGHAVTAPVGSFSASPIGLFDLGGNAAEWVNDRYTVYPSGGALAVDPTGPADGQYHVIRGSGWRHSGISELRLSYRDFGDSGRLDVGFRIARTADDKER
ncbi:MAG: PEGA domain-containing protein [Gammaproteobacteria bacterium]|nr:PEGA domain-containing protein [Gammaproteobacteria bacterium]